MEFSQQLETALMQQKNVIRDLINDSLIDDEHMPYHQPMVQDYDKLRDGLIILQANCHVWCALSYGYKGVEITERVSDAARHTLLLLHPMATKQCKKLDEILLICDEIHKMFYAQPIL